MYGAWYEGALVLAASAMACCLLVRRRMGVSGHISSWVDRLRDLHAPPPDPGLIAALREATAQAFGQSSLTAVPAEPAPPAIGVSLVVPAGLLVGGALSAAFGGFPRVSTLLSSSRLPFHGAAAALALACGGFLVGFGARLAGGCTMGHGLIGVSQLQPGSIAATAGFFAMGVTAAFLLGSLG